MAAARTALAAAPDSLPARFKLADALIDANCFHDAVHTLEDGEAIHPRSAELQAKLRNTRSLVSEQEYFAGKEQAELAARVSRNLLRCTKLGDIDACDEALKLKPDDVRDPARQGRCVAEGGAPGGRGIRLSTRAQASRPTMRASRRSSRRRARSASRCWRSVVGRGDDAALAACQGALSKGARERIRDRTRAWRR